MAVAGSRRLGIMGGTFNPIHFGHLFTAEAAKVNFKLDRVIFVPTGQEPLKQAPDLAPSEERHTMAVIATAANTGFFVSRLEIDRRGPSYTIETLKLLHKEFGEETELFFITGADAVLEILEWKDPESMAGFCEFIAASRPGYDLGRLQTILDERPRLPSVHMMEIPALAISSTDLRRRIKAGLPIRYLLPDAVASYIDKLGLYL